MTLVPAIEHRRNPELYDRTEFDPTKLQYPPMRGIPPGEYTLYAWDNISDDAEQSADFLREYQNRGVPVTVRPQQTATVELPPDFDGQVAPKPIEFSNLRCL